MSKNLLNLLLLVASFALYYVVLGPLWSGAGSVWQPSQGITTLKSLNVQYTDTISQAETLLSQAESLQKQYGNISEASKEKMALMVPNKVDPVRLLSEVSSIANQTGLTVGGLGYTELPEGNGKGGYLISFNVKTNYEKFKELMYNYETSLRLFTVKNVSFTVPEKDTSIITFQVKLETYYIK